MYRYAGDYSYRRALGDYYAGDPGFPIVGALAGGLIKRGVKALAKGAGKLLGKRGRKAIASAAPAAGGVALERLRARALQAAPPGMKPVKGLKGKIQRALPGGKTGYFKTRRMNPLNPKALRRATRRLTSFRAHAASALRELGFTIKRTGAARGGKRRRGAACR